MDYKNIIAEKICELVELDKKVALSLIEIPPKVDMGDFAFPCFQLSKIMRKSPNMIAEELKNKMDVKGFDKIDNLGPYLNFFVSKAELIGDTITKILLEGKSYGSSKTGAGKNVTIDYSSPNIAKPFHVGHLSTTVIGNALYKIMSFEGYNCIGINHLGDWGTQFGKLISAYKRWGNEEALEKEPIKELLRIYVKFHDEAESDTTLNDEARMYFKNLEDGSQEEIQLWTKFKDLSLKEFNIVYDLLGVKFDSYAGESFYNDKMDAIVEELDSKGLLSDSNGAKVVMLEQFNMPPTIIKKSDGATIYATRDITAAKYRKDTYDFYKNIYVVGTTQSLHFKQIFTTLKLMGYQWADDCKHVGFGLVKFADKKLSTRKGDVILLEDFLKESVAATLEIINEKNPSLENKESVAKKIGVGAMIFAYLKNNREKDIVFDWKEMLSFDGETGPYAQYTYARAKSILRKTGEVDGKIEYGKIESKEEFELVKLLKELNAVVLHAIDKLEPSIVTRYVVDIASAFNKFYNLYNISNTEDIGLKNARIKMVEATCIVLKTSLNMLGIEVVEEM
jgi:arginyl-tRNA synthetase